MRILMISPFVGDRYGQERVLRDSSRLLRSAGHEVFVVAAAQHGEMPALEGHHFVPELGFLHSLSPKADVKQALGALNRYALQVKPDLVHFIDAFDARVVNFFLPRVATVYAAHSVAPTCPSSNRITNQGICGKRSGYACLAHNRKYQCLEGYRGTLRQAHAVYNHLVRTRALKKCGAVIAVSDYIQHRLEADGWDASKITRIYNPVEVKARPAPDGHPVPENLMVCASRLSPIKGIDGLLDALAELKDLPWQLHLCGDGPLRMEMSTRCRTLGIENRVHFLGTTGFERTRQIISSARVLLQPNLGPESFGLSAAEAISMGVPVIASNVPALNEIVSHEKNGLLVPERSPRAMAESIRRLLTDDVLHTRLSQAGPAWIRQQFSPAQHLKQTLEVYESLVTSPAVTRRASPAV
jgi:glycosyltransferase involved in cell wall biosynthesis